MKYESKFPSSYFCIPGDSANQLYQCVTNTKLFKVEVLPKMKIQILPNHPHADGESR